MIGVFKGEGRSQYEWSPAKQEVMAEREQQCVGLYGAPRIFPVKTTVGGIECF